ncbi:hypothetical protein OF83DRAFT_288268 [Amylostereum chailletii]|nr:hypothetical protein OF83DRAFT_288268 [Amylostereum chailletii]
MHGHVSFFKWVNFVGCIYHLRGRRFCGRFGSAESVNLLTCFASCYLVVMSNLKSDRFNHSFTSSILNSTTIGDQRRTWTTYTFPHPTSVVDRSATRRTFCTRCLICSKVSYRRRSDSRAPDVAGDGSCLALSVSKTGLSLGRPTKSLSKLSLVRLVVLGTTLLFSLIVLGVSADLLNTTVSELDGSYFVFSALAVAVAVITIVSVVPMIVIDFLRQGAFTSLVWVEVAWFSVLWILWLSTGADTAWANDQVFVGSSCDFANSIVKTFCNEFKAVMAFSFLTWIVLMAYTSTLIVLAFIGHSRSQRTWTSTVREGFVDGPQEEKAVDMGATTPAHSATYTPAPVSMSVQRAEV